MGTNWVSQEFLNKTTPLQKKKKNKIQEQEKLVLKNTTTKIL